MIRERGYGLKPAAVVTVADLKNRVSKQIPIFDPGSQEDYESTVRGLVADFYRAPEEGTSKHTEMSEEIDKRVGELNELESTEEKHKYLVRLMAELVERKEKMDTRGDKSISTEYSPNYK